MVDKVLSQEEIDAMLNGGSIGGGDSAAAESPAPEEPPAPAAPPPVAAAPPPPVAAAPAAGIDANTQALINGLLQRVENLEAGAQRMAQMEQSLADANATISQMKEEFESVSSQIQLVSGRMEGILQNLKGTMGYRAQKTFVCNKCETRGEVATQVRCTHCGQNNWWGWWPKKEE